MINLFHFPIFFKTPQNLSRFFFFFFCSRTFMSLATFMLWRELEAPVDVSSIQRSFKNHHQTPSVLVRSHRAPVQTVTTCSKTQCSDSQGIHQHTMSQLSCQGLESSVKSLCSGWKGKSSLAIKVLLSSLRSFCLLKLCFHHLQLHSTLHWKLNFKSFSNYMVNIFFVTLNEISLFSIQ